MIVDLIVRNARIDTRDPQRPTASTIAVLHGRVVALDEQTEGLEARETLDAGGLSLLPGFNDVHAHSVWFGTTLMEADLSTVASFDDIYAAIERQAQSTAEGDWVVAAGYNPVLLGSTHPDRDRLDAASGGRPVWVLPNPSGLNAHHQLPELARRFADVRDACCVEIEHRRR